MSWHFSQALVAAYSQGISLDGEPSVLSKETPTPLAYLCSDRMTAFSIRSLYGMTFAPLMEGLGEAVLTWFLAAFPAKTSASQATAKASMVSAPASGLRWTESLARLDPLSSSWRTHQCLLFGGEYESLQTLPPWGICADGELWGLPQRVLYVKAKDSGLSLLRPTAHCWKAWTFLNIKSLIRRNHADGNIQEQSARCLHKMITAESNEILMQWPSKWTDLRPLAMDKIHDWRSSHGPY